MLANNAFTKAAISVNGGEWKKAVLKYFGGQFYLLSHTRRLFGELPEGMSKHGMLGGIAFTPECSFVESWGDLHGATININRVNVTITLDAETIESVHSRATSTTRTRRPAATTPEAPAAETTAPAENPYMLPNYTQNVYEGFAGYHASHRAAMNTPTNGYNGYRIGVELETEFSTSAARSKFTGTPRNWFFCESDASLGGYGCEMITIPLTPADAKNRATWKPICDRLKALGATSWDNNNCGLHVHIGREILGDSAEERNETLGKLLYFYDSFVNDDTTATKVFGRSRCYHEGNNRDHDLLKAVNLLGKDTLKIKSVADNVKAGLVRANNNGNRYNVINTTNAATIEFRKGRGSLSVDRIQTIITFCESCCLYAKATEMADMSAESFKEWIRANVPTSNALYHYYEVIERDC